jgi:hypothetical protein
MSSTTNNGGGAPVEAVNAAVQKVIDAVEHPPVLPAPDPNVTAAFTLGWQMAELYRPDAMAPPPACDADLPSLGRLDEAERAQISLDQIKVALVKLDPTVQAADLPLPDVKPVSDAFEAGVDPAGRRPAIRALHVALLSTLTAADFRLGKAYGLGRSLADICRATGTWAELEVEFETERIEPLCARIEDLASAFPAHSAHSVSGSLRLWRDFVAGPPPPEAAARRQAALDALVRQGQLWRSLLSGERSGADMLEIPDYLDAAGRLLTTTRGLAVHFVKHFPVVVVAILALFGGGVALILDPQTSDSILAGAGGILASLGLTWKTLGATLGGLGGTLEQHVWEAELDNAITDAITMPPIGTGRPGPPTDDAAEPAGAPTAPVSTAATIPAPAPAGTTAPAATTAPAPAPATTPPAVPAPDPTPR